MSRRTICVVTGTRADYGLLYWLLRELQDDSRIELQVIVTGMHLSPEFGLTGQTVANDGFPIAASVDLLLSSNSSVGVTKSVGVGVIGFADALHRLRPDLLVVLGDRFEILAAAQAALLARIPIAHLHGGETTEGAMDEAIRHAVTKMAQLHFVSAEPYRRRVIQMGEQPSHVWTVGALGLDNIRRLTLLDRDALSRDLGVSLDGPLFLLTYHPVTLASGDACVPLRELFRALDTFPHARILMTKANADESGTLVNAEIDAYAALHPDRVIVRTSLGQLRYLSAMALADVVIGNSSSGIIEAPALRRPTVNVGPRQRGRLRAPSIIDTDERAEDIAAGIQRALSPAFLSALPAGWSVYGDGTACRRIAEVLASVPLDRILMKRFYDLPLPEPAEVAPAGEQS